MHFPSSVAPLKKFRNNSTAASVCTHAYHDLNLFSAHLVYPEENEPALKKGGHCN